MGRSVSGAGAARGAQRDVRVNAVVEVARWLERVDPPRSSGTRFCDASWQRWIAGG